MLAFQATKRGLTDRETTMEDTHVWVMNADGSGRREIWRDRQPPGRPEWTPDGAAVCSRCRSAGTCTCIARRSTGGRPEAIVSGARRGRRVFDGEERPRLHARVARPICAVVCAPGRLDDVDGARDDRPQRSVGSTANRSPRSSRLRSSPMTTSTRSRRSSPGRSASTDRHAEVSAHREHPRRARTASRDRRSISRTRCMPRVDGRR